MINYALDLAHWRAQLQRDGRMQVESYLQPDPAERLLQAAGMPLLPPAGWLPDNERLHSLVTTGREPPGE